MSVQAPSAALLIRPRFFTPNPETALDNAFQSRAVGDDADALAAAAYAEVSEVAATLDAHGITVHLFDDDGPGRPDSVFPNNWISTHAGGHVGLYPMHTPNRRTERRGDIVEMLKQTYRVQDVVDYSGLELDDVFLEGTGAMVLDHGARIAYVARSRRADPIALERFCTNFGYEPMVFDAVDDGGTAIYHTNVMMCIATDFALVGLGLIQSSARRGQVVERLSSQDREVIDLDQGQIRDFAGNAIELHGKNGRILALSERALASLTAPQRRIIERSCEIVPLSVPTIELAGGSVRCMVAGIHLDRRSVVVGSAAAV
ncbi:arginine deiminase-related protein [Cryobacterium sp. PH31-AA6]|uniref:citrulline utilization hydrolase CtlX n=1 Tax=Cryobacterium sp. PH31-AA6 TaxID=3046205 RepID=UPI0024BB1117|nr:arginine deiminase-related protein [Cryobacterium sp. PH31-AA6]MDJ0324845.1 arginine deiminase-related protein [Cryobacterium sp. PH31-AA6]